MAKRKGEPRLSSEGARTQLIAEGQPRGLAGPSDMELDGKVIGSRSGFRYATGREKESVVDWGLQMLRNKH